MARTTAIVNLKGGVAKTTTTVNMAAILAMEHGKKVLVIDADSQCNTTEFFGGDPSKGSLADVLRKANAFLDGKSRWNFGGMIQTTRIPGVELLPADDSLMDMDLSKVEQRTVNARVLRWLLEDLKDLYDFCIIDCPPAFNAASAAALIAANDVIIPMKLDAFSIRGMGNLMRQVKNMRKINPQLKLAGILPTMWYRDEQNAIAEQQLYQAGFHIFPHIRATRKVDMMTWKQEPLAICSPRCAAGRDYKRFVQFYLNGETGGAEHG